ncbi:MAG: hypothetical protein ABW321_22945 [Polyangiales bacterium]
MALSLILFAVLDLTIADTAQPWYLSQAFTIALTSGDTWYLSGGDLFLLFSMAMLFIEILRSTRSDGHSIINHAFSAVVFVVALMLFVTRRGYGNSTFFIYVSMTLLDFMAGFIITAVSARRDVSFQNIGNQG